MTSRQASRPIATPRLLRAVAGLGLVSALALVGVSAPANAHTDAPATVVPSASAESKGTISGSVKLEDGKKFSYAYLVVYRKVSGGGDPWYGGVWTYVKSAYFGGGGAGTKQGPMSTAPEASSSPEETKRWEYKLKKLPAGTYRLEAGAAGSEHWYGGPQAYKKGATVLSGDNVKVKAGKTTKDINFKLVKAKKQMTDVEVAIAGDPVVGETLTASMTGAPSGSDVLFSWYRLDDYSSLGYGQSLTLTPELAGVTVEVSAVAYKLGWWPGSGSAEIGPISTAG